MTAMRLASRGVFAATIGTAILLSPGAVHAAAPGLHPAGARLKPGSVTIIDTRTNRVAATVRVGLVPHQVVVTPDGATAYVLNGFSYTVTQIRLGRRVTSRRVRAGSFPIGLAISPGGKKLYISRHSNTAPGSVLPVNARTGVPGRPVNLSLTDGQISAPIAVVPDGRRVLATESFVGLRSREGLLPIRTATDTRGRVARFGRASYGPVQMLVTPDSRTAFVLSAGNPTQGDLLTPIQIASGTARKSLVLPSPQVTMAMTPDGRLIYLADYYDGIVTVVRTDTNTIVRRLHVYSAFSLAISPDGKTVYAGGNDPNTGIPEVVIIATARNTTSTPILLSQQGGVVNTIAVTPNGRTAYFAINSFVIPMRTTTRTLGTPIPVGPDPIAIAIARHGSAMYVVNANNAS